MLPRRQPPFFRLLAVAALACFGCGDAAGTVQGGQYLLATDAGTTPSADAGETWRDLYASFFGPTGSSPCGGMLCHGTGGTASPYWVCGESATACLQGLMAASLIPKGGAADFTTIPLYPALRKTTCTPGPITCNMPVTPAYQYTAADLARIGAWVQSGAADN